MRGTLALILWLVTPVAAQSVRLFPAPVHNMPSPVDSNSPVVWWKGKLLVFNSVEKPMLAIGESLFEIEEKVEVDVQPRTHFPMWIEAAWADDEGTIFAWYHHEPKGTCPGNSLSAPEIGALVSHDGGRSFKDLGIVLSAGDQPDCDAANGFFTSGHGDFSVVPDHERRYVYFFFGNYGGPLSGQGIGVARMHYEERHNPIGAVRKYFEGAWDEPGVGGRLSPIFPAREAWQKEKTDAFWGPSIHWNTFLEKWVLLFTRSCCRSKWPMDGVFLSMADDIANPGAWSEPTQILGPIPRYYPQIVGLEADGTDKRAGEKARFYMQGQSEWEIVFYPPEDPPPPPPPDGASAERLRQSTPSTTGGRLRSMPPVVQ